MVSIQCLFVGVKFANIFFFLKKKGSNNRLDKCQAIRVTPELHHQQQLDHTFSLNTFLDFAIQCCNCLEMIHKHQSKIQLDLYGNNKKKIDLVI